ncbi:MAG: hypothetical protein R2795_09820 [Saprospiraceae bacterium]
MWESWDGGLSWEQRGSTSDWTTGHVAQDAPQWAYGTSYNGIVKTLGHSFADPNAIYWTNVQWAFGSYDGEVLPSNNYLPMKYLPDGGNRQASTT